MTLQEQIQKSLVNARKVKDSNTLSTMQVVVGEMQRLPKKVLNDDEVISLLKKIVANEQEKIDKYGKGDEKFIQIINDFIPSELPEEDIIDWIKENIDFSSLKNKMQAIGIVTKNFGSLVDGKKVKEIIERCFNVQNI
ncbi:GatB/YqeY domain-containing protein [uncultured Arcobacter sp.]|uniref:GatB/YqeY domain-containing protein n=1 Tax=uncultured Arcobacter sp. TaxID=165434 RepID=UPI0026206FF8|nr:GatB/YqeY domain-containing protein [uncultured Arcobacter sp.]